MLYATLDPILLQEAGNHLAGSTVFHVMQGDVRSTIALQSSIDFCFRAESTVRVACNSHLKCPEQALTLAVLYPRSMA
jgi:hypothetical protein